MREDCCRFRDLAKLAVQSLDRVRRIDNAADLFGAVIEWGKEMLLRFPAFHGKGILRKDCLCLVQGKDPHVQIGATVLSANRLASEGLYSSAFIAVHEEMPRLSWVFFLRVELRLRRELSYHHTGCESQ